MPGNHFVCAPFLAHVAPVSLAVLVLHAGLAAAQVSVRTVAQPTRIDWQFAVRGFGKVPPLPADYDANKQKYQLFIPKGHDPARSAALVLFISPGNEPAGFAACQKVCKEHGVLFASPYQAGNNIAIAKRTRIVFDVLDDIRRKHKIDADRTYLAGFSGGGRMACALGFALSEYFGGIIPVCGTNPIGPPDYVRHRAQDRLSVAFVTGATDFNRKENEIYMHPLLNELGVRSRLWIAAGVGHQIPGADLFAEVFAWLEDDLPRRRADAKKRPQLGIAPDDISDAKRFLAAADAELVDPERIWHGVALLQGIKIRWPKTPAAQEAQQRLKNVTQDARLLEAIGVQGAADEQKTLKAQARGFERFGISAKAIQAWQTLADHYPGTPIAQEATVNVRRLQKK